MANIRQAKGFQKILDHSSQKLLNPSTAQNRNFRTLPSLCSQKNTHSSLLADKPPQNDSLFNGLVDMTFLKRPGEVLPKSDKFYADLPNQSTLPSTTGLFFNPGNTYTIGISNALMYNNPTELWSEFHKTYTHDPNILHDLTRFQWSAIIRLLTNRRVPENSWSNMKFVVESMMQLGHDLKSWEWIRVMGLAARDKDVEGIQQIWNIIEQTGTDKTTALWNSYISQTTGTDAFQWVETFRDRKRISPPAKIPQNNAIQLISTMIENNIQPNASTYEMLMLHFAQFDDLERAESLISSVWGISLNPADEKATEATVTAGNLAYPTYFTLVAIINAFGSKGYLVQGLQLMQAMQKKYNIDIGKGSKSLVLWKTMMKWAFLTLEPHGETPEKTLDYIWDAMRNTYNIHPDSFIIRLRISREISVRNYGYAAELLPMYIEQDESERAKMHLASSLRKISKGYIKNKQFSECRELLGKWAAVDPFFRQVVEDFVRKNPELN